MSCGSSMLAMILSFPPQRAQVSISIAKHMAFEVTICLVRRLPTITIKESV
jgi:hypothetical protein